MRDNPAIQRFTLATAAGIPPYQSDIMRMRKGLKRTAFHPTVGRFATDYKVHNSYLKPDFITDPLDEYWTMRRVAGLWDVTGEEVIEIAGREALALMDELVPRDLTRLKDGHCLYCIMCYDYGGIVEDAVLIRFNDRKFWWVGGPGFSEQWIYGHALGRDVDVRHYLDTYHVASLQGPKSRDILQRVCDADLSQVPFYGMVESRVCGVPTVISRTGFTAELGYDIYVHIEGAARMFEDLWAVGRPDGVKLCGSRALNIRRTEAAIINFSQDFDWQHNPFEVGLGWMVNFNKPGFHGKDALADIRRQGPKQKLIGLRLAHDEAAFTCDPVQAAGQTVGEVTSATMSPSLDQSIAIAMVRTEASAVGTKLTVRCGEKPVAAEVVAMPFFDPERRLSKT